MKTLLELLDNPSEPIAHEMSFDEKSCIIFPGYGQETAREIFNLSDYYVSSSSGGCYSLMKRDNNNKILPLDVPITFNEWFIKLHPERQDILRNDKWMLAEAAFHAGYESARLIAAKK